MQYVDYLSRHNEKKTANKSTNSKGFLKNDRNEHLILFSTLIVKSEELYASLVTVCDEKEKATNVSFCSLLMCACFNAFFTFLSF